MKVAAMFGDKKGGLVVKPDPKAKGEFVVVKIIVTPMCTEYHGFNRGNKSESLGHEAAGEVVEVASPAWSRWATVWLCSRSMPVADAHCASSVRIFIARTGGTSMPSPVQAPALKPTPNIY